MKQVLRENAKVQECHDDMERLWQVTLESIGSLNRADRIAYFNAKRFLSFQFAKLLDTLQNPSRRAYQILAYSPSTSYAKGPYPVFDNVTALFAANPVIGRNYVNGAFLNADAAFEVLEGMKTLEVRMMSKCINTQILARFLASHRGITVHCNALPHNENAALRERLMFLGLPAPLFTCDFGDYSA